LPVWHHSCCRLPTAIRSAATRSAWTLGGHFAPTLAPRPSSREDVAITLTPLPVWADLDAAARRAKVAALIADIEVEHAGATG
jgi:hypothetical protein